MFTAAVVDADPDGPEPWLATAYVAGPSLTDAVDETGPMPVDPVLALAAGLAEGLQAIHRRSEPGHASWNLASIVGTAAVPANWVLVSHGLARHGRLF